MRILVIVVLSIVVSTISTAILIGLWLLGKAIGFILPILVIVILFILAIILVAKESKKL